MAKRATPNLFAKRPAMITLLLALTLAAETPAPPTTVAPVISTAPEAKKKGYDPDRIVCRSITRPQSRMSDRVCATQAEWDDRQVLDQTMRERMMTQRAGSDLNRR
jgi:hypothetical protein